MHMSVCRGALHTHDVYTCQFVESALCIQVHIYLQHGCERVDDIIAQHYFILTNLRGHLLLSHTHHLENVTGERGGGEREGRRERERGERREKEGKKGGGGGREGRNEGSREGERG